MQPTYVMPHEVIIAEENLSHQDIANWFFPEGVSTGALASSYVGGGGEDLQGLLGKELGGGSDTRRASFESVWWVKNFCRYYAALELRQGDQFLLLGPGVT